MATAANKFRANRIRGIVDDASALEISRDHLRLVLNGERVSPKLLKRYRALKREQKSAEVQIARQLPAVAAEITRAANFLNQKHAKKSKR